MLELVILFVGVDAQAQQRVRRRFDPEELKLEAPGVVHADLAFGVVRGEEGGRWLVPDFDVDVGLAPNVEVGVDGAWAIEGTPQQRYALDHRAPDNLWLSSKAGLWESKDEARRSVWAFGGQLGPRVPVAPNAHGTGFEALALLARRAGPMHLVLNLGGLVESGAEVRRGRPEAVLTGLDASFDLDDRGRFALAADLGGVFFVTGEKAQLASTAGLVWATTSWLDLGVSAMMGFLAGGDRYGMILNFSPKLALF